MTHRCAASVSSVVALVVAAIAGAYPDRPAATPIHAAALGGAVLLPSAAAPLPDPIFLQRVFLPPDRRDTANRDVTRGVLLKLPKAEFEERIQAAARVRFAAQNPSRILEAMYRASVRPGRVEGAAVWNLAHPVAPYGAMRVDPLPGAIRTLRWTNGQTPILFRTPPEEMTAPATFLAIDGAAQDRFSFDWSVRIVEQPDDERCILTFPAAPVSMLELAIPEDRIPTAEPSGVLVTGPFPAPEGGERLWKLAFGGQTRLDLSFRKSRASEESPAAYRARRAAVWKCDRVASSAQFDFSLHSAHSGNRPLAFAVDPGLEIATVAGAAVESWLWTADTPRQLRVTLRPGSASPRISIRANSAAGSASANWTPPQIRLLNATLESDTVEFDVPPDCKLEGWQSGDYRVGSTALLPDGTSKLEFVPALFTSDDRSARRAPSIRLRPVDQEYSTVESLEWRLEPNRSKLSASYSIKALRGPIPSFGFLVFPGYQLENITFTPDDPAAAFGALPGVAGGWSVEPSRAVASGQSLELRLDFRESAGTSPTPPIPDGAKPTPLPRVTPLGSVERRGTYTVRPLGGMKVSTAGFSPAIVPLVGEAGFGVPYRGREPEGDVLVSHANSVLSARMETGFAANGDGLRASSTLSASVAGMPLESMLVWVPGREVRWRFEPSAGAVRTSSDPLFQWLPGLGSHSRWATLALATMDDKPRGSLWRIAPSRPVLGDFTCTASWDVPQSGPDGAVRQLILPHFFGVPISDSTAKLDSALSHRYRIGPSTDGRAPQTITLIPKDAAVEVTAPSVSDGWLFRDLQSIDRIEAGDRIRTTLRGTVVRPGAPRLRLPIDCDRLESVLIDGKWLAITRAELAEQGLPIAKAGTTFEVQSTRRLESSLFGLLKRAESPTPMLPGDPAIRSEWSLAPEYRNWPGLERGALAGESERLFAVRESTVRAGSWIAAILLAGGLIALRNRSAAPASIALALALGAACWLAPAGWYPALRTPLAAAFVGAALLFLAKRRDVAIALVAGCFVGLSGLVATGQAQAPEPAVVYVVPGPAEHPDRYAVLAPKAVLDRLAAIARSPVPDAVILSADYDCTAIGDTVSVLAKYAVHSVDPDEHLLAIPLAGIRLEKATLDGREAFPDATKPDRFLIPIRGAGTHEIALQFAVSAQTAGIDREAKFAVPDLPVSHVGFSAGLLGRQLDVPSRLGGQTVRPTTAGLRAEAEQGGGKSITLRWRSGAAAAAKPSILVKEGAVWDLGETENLLTAAWQCRVEGGTVSGMKLELPDGILPSSVNVEAADGAMPGLGIRSWKAGAPSAGMTPVDVRFQNPVEGRFTLVLKGYSVKLPGLRPVLHFPKIAGIAEADRDSFHAVRIGALRADGVAVTGAIDYPAEAVEREFAKVPEFNFAKSPPARVVRRGLGQTTELRPVLLPTLAYRALGGEAVYTLGRGVEAEGAMRVGAGDSGTAEFDVPAGLILRDVWSPDLAGWSRSGARVQVRWSKPVADAIVRWSGQLPNPTGGGVIDLPLPRWSSAAAKLADPIVVRVRPAPGWTIAPLPVAGLTAKASATTEEWLLAVEPLQNPTAKFTSNPLPKPQTPPERRVPPQQPAPSPPEDLPPANVESAGTSAAEMGSSALFRGALWLGAAAIPALMIARRTRRGRPEVLALLGLAAVAVLGTGSTLALPFWALAGCAILIRALKLTRRIARSAFA